MAIKPITTFNGDPWKKQDEESDRAHHYFKQYKPQLLTKREFIQLLLEEADQRTTKGHIKFTAADEKYNQEHQKEIQLYVDSKGKKGKCPKPCGTVNDWFNLHKWFFRRKKYHEMLDEESDVNVKALLTSLKSTIANGLGECILNTIETRKERKDTNSHSQDEAGAKSINTDIDSLKKLSNDDATKINANINAEVEADVKQQLTIAEDKEKKLKDLFERMEQMEYD